MYSAMIAKAQEFGEIKYLVNGAGVLPSQAPIEAILKVDLYGTAVLLEEVGKGHCKGRLRCDYFKSVGLENAAADCRGGQAACDGSDRGAA